VEDAVVLYTIEGQGGGNSAYQTLAAYHGSDGWRLQQTWSSVAPRNCSVPAPRRSP
jgi:hypothetical protein